MTQRGFYSQDVAVPSTFREQGKNSPRQTFGIEVVPGGHCELQCEACYKRNKNGRPIHQQPSASSNGEAAIPLAEIQSYIAQARAAGFQEVALLGGEPILHPDIFEIIRFVRREQGMAPILCTNGMSFTDVRNARRLEDTRTTVVTHAYLPGAEHDIDLYSGQQGYADMLRRAIENLRQIPGVTLVLEMPLTRLLLPHAFAFFQYCREHGFTPFIEISRSRDNGEPTTSVTPEEVAELFHRFCMYDEEHHPDLVDACPTPPAYGTKCTMSMTGVHVKNLGRGDYGGLYSCCAQGIRHGDLKTQPLAEILRSPTMELFVDQDRFIVGPCRDCDFYNVCKGGCRGEAYLKFGCPRASCPACYLIAPEARNDPRVMAPASCDDCPAEHCSSCSLPSF